MKDVRHEVYLFFFYLRRSYYRPTFRKTLGFADKKKRTVQARCFPKYWKTLAEKSAR